MPVVALCLLVGLVADVLSFSSVAIRSVSEQIRTSGDVSVSLEFVLLGVLVVCGNRSLAFRLLLILGAGSYVALGHLSLDSLSLLRLLV